MLPLQPQFLKKSNCLKTDLKRTMAGTFLWNFIKFGWVVSDKMLKIKVITLTDARRMDIAPWHKPRPVELKDLCPNNKEKHLNIPYSISFQAWYYRNMYAHNYGPYFNKRFVSLVVAPHELQHYIFIRFWKVPMEAVILFAGFQPCSSQNHSSHGLFVWSKLTNFVYLLSVYRTFCCHNDFFLSYTLVVNTINFISPSSLKIALWARFVCSGLWTIR